MSFSRVDEPSDNRTMLPRWICSLFYLLLVGAACLSVPFVGDDVPLPLGVILDVWIAALAVMMIARGNLPGMPLLLFVIAYSLTRLLPALAVESPLWDFVQAYRWLLYIGIVAVAVGRSWVDLRGLKITTWFVLCLALLKYGLTFVLTDERPMLFTENNFEIPLFAGLLLSVYRHLGSSRLLLLAIFGAVVLLSESRSGAVIGIIVFLYVIVNSNRSNILTRYILILGVPFVAVAALLVFLERADGVSVIDRILFLDVFFREVSDWDPFQWVYGTTPISPLSNASCNTLSYYSSLFSSEGDGSCYSVILHAFILRVLFDAGLIGLGIAFLAPAYAMYKSRVPLSTVVAVMAIVAANSMSVSGLNNPYVALTVLLAILTAPGVEHESIRVPIVTRQSSPRHFEATAHLNRFN